MSALPDIIATSARFSPCETFRYDLTRTLSVGHGVCTFVMLNPSTATADVLDPTVRRCLGFTARWGFQTMRVVNCFALRSTDPKQLRKVIDPVGPENDAAIRAACQDAALVVLAWGAHAALHGRDRAVATLIRETIGFANVGALRWSKRGAPGHPLYLPNDSPLLPVPDGWLP